MPNGHKRTDDDEKPRKRQRAARKLAMLDSPPPKSQRSAAHPTARTPRSHGAEEGDASRSAEENAETPESPLASPVGVLHTIRLSPDESSDVEQTNPAHSYDEYVGRVTNDAVAVAIRDLSSQARGKLDEAGVKERHYRLLLANPAARQLCDALSIGDRMVLEELVRAVPACESCWKGGRRTRCKHADGMANEAAISAPSPSSDPVKPTAASPITKYKSVMPARLPTWNPESTGTDTARSYIRRFEITAESENYDPGKWGLALLLQMRGSAAKWANSWMESHQELLYAEIKQAFVQHYTEVDEKRSFWLDYISIKQKASERAREFCVRFRELAERLDRDFTDEQTLFHFARALHGKLADRYDTAMAIDPPKNLSAAFARAIQLDGHEKRHTGAASSSSESGSSSIGQDEKKRDGKGCSMHRMPYRLPNGAKNPKWHTEADCRSKHRSGSDGGKASSVGIKDKPAPPPAQPRDGSSAEAKKPVKCYNCGGDHYRSSCPHKNQGFQQVEMMEYAEHLLAVQDALADAENASGASAQLADDCLDQFLMEEGASDPIMIDVMVEGIVVRALVDTGCDETYLHVDWARQHGIPTIPVHGSIRMGQEGQVASRIGRTPPLMLQLNDGRTVTAELELSKPRHTMYLGRNLMTRLGIGMTNLPQASPINTDQPPIADQPPSSVEGAVPHPGREAILAAIQDVLEANQQVSGFCPMPEAVVRLKMNDCSPVYIRQYKVAEIFHAAVEKQIDAWLERGVIKKIQHSKFNNPLTVSWKKDAATGKKGDPANVRVNFDGRSLNKRIPTYPFEIPLITDIFERAAGAQIYSCIDLKDAFCTFPVLESDQKYLAFTWNNQAYTWLGAPFGLKILSQQFQRVMKLLFADFGHFVTVFIDDICAFSASVEEHAVQLEAVVRRLTENNFRINIPKSSIAYESVFLLGHRISSRGVEIDRRKLIGIDEWPRPTGETIEHFLGLTNYFRSFVPGYARVVAPLNQVRKAFSWGEEQEQSWLAIKRMLAAAPLIHVPDFSRTFYIACDASNAGIGAALFQLADDSQAKPDLRPDPKNHRFVALASRGLQKSERNYSATKKEALALVFALTKFRYYVLGKRTVVYSDHRALVWLFDQYDSNKLTNTWLDTYMEFDIEVVHLPGLKNVLPDHLSRIYSTLGGKSSDNSASRHGPSSPASKQISAAAVDMKTASKGAGKQQAARTSPSINNASQQLSSTVRLPAYEPQKKQAWLKAVKRALKIDRSIELPAKGTKFPRQEWGKRCFVDCTINPLMIKKTLTKAIAEAMQNDRTSTLLVPEWTDAPWYSWVVQSLDVQPVEATELLIVTINPKNAAATTKTPSDPSFNRAIRMIEPIAYDTVDNEEQRKAIVGKHHSMGHFGASAMVKSIMAEGQYWSSIRADCAAEAAACQACQRYNIRQRGYHPLTPITASMPWDHVAIDLAQLTTSPINGYTYLAVIVDVCTRYVFLRPLRTKSAVEIAETLFKLFCDVGFPRILQSDNGSEFVNELIAALLDRMEIEHRTTTAYHPRGNGLAERTVKMAKDTILKMLAGATTEWVERVPFVQAALNFKVSALHGSSPFSLFFARKFNFFSDYTKAISDPLKIDELQRRYEFFNELVFPAVAESSQSTQRERSLRFNQANWIVDIQKGSQVMTVPSVRTNKAEARYEGPFTVVRRTAGGSYQLLDADGQLLSRNYAPSQLKLIALPPDDASVPGSFAAKQAERAYAVDRIVDDRMQRGQRYYLVRWAGYSKQHDSWEPESNFNDQQVIQRYWTAKRSEGAAAAARTQEGQLFPASPAHKNQQAVSARTRSQVRTSASHAPVERGRLRRARPSSARASARQSSRR